MRRRKYVVGAAFLIWLVPSALAGAVLRVCDPAVRCGPLDEFTSIQDAVDVANSGDTILVGRGHFAGAVIWGVGLKIRGSGVHTVIDQGTWLSAEDAFDLIEASGSAISDLLIQGPWLSWGVYSEYSADVTVSKVTCAEVRFCISNWNGSRWLIADNHVEGFGGLYNDGIIIASWDPSYPASENLVAKNRIVHRGVATAPPPAEVYTGIYLGSFGGLVERNRVVLNDVSIVMSTAPTVEPENVSAWAVILQEWAAPGSVRDNVVALNDLRGTCVDQLPKPMIGLRGTTPTPEVLDANFLWNNREGGCLPE